MTNEMLDAAIEYVRRGWPVLPLVPGKKTPLTKNGFYDATTDEAQIRTWLSEHPDANIGLRVGIDSALLVLDVDNKGGKNGSGELVKLFEQLGELPNTYAVKTPTGGYHYYFTFSRDLVDKLLTAELIAGIDVKSKGFVVAPPSVVNGGEYTIVHNEDLASLPEAWVNECIKRDVSREDWEKLARPAGSGQSICEEYNIRLGDVLTLPSDARKTNEGYLIKHPLHGATGDGNLALNMSRDLWHCFRHGSGGDPLTYLAVREGFIDCADAGPLDRDTTKGCLEVLRKEGRIPEAATLRKRDVLAKGDESEETENGEGDAGFGDPWQYFTDGDENGKNRKFVPKKLGDAILENNRFLRLLDTDEIFVYDQKSGRYTGNGEAVIRKEAQQRLEDLFSGHRVNEALTYIHDSDFVNREDIEPPVNLIPAANGLLDITPWLNGKFVDLDKLTPSEYSPDVPMFVKHTGSYRPELLENPPVIALKFIRSIFPSDELNTVQELIGACLYRGQLYKKAFMLLGDGDNGKSIFLNWLRKMLGESVVSKQSLYALTYNRFAPSDLYHKNANIHADLGGGDLAFIGTFMILTGGDSLTVERKHQHPFSYVCYAVMIYSTNELPNVKNPPDQFYNRWILIEMPYKFVDNPDPEKDDYEKQRVPEQTLEAQLHDQDAIDFLFTYGVEGLKRLLEQGHYTESESTKAIKTRWISKTDSLQAFVNTMVQPTEGSRVRKDLFKVAYEAWCGEVGMVPQTDAYIGRNLPRFIPTKQVFTKPVRSWANIAVKGVVSEKMPEAEQTETTIESFTFEGD